ncbi:MAG: nucleoside 2-deoxyribosyltransferase [Candidatus Zixiibacteriota bacterium]
MADTKPKPFVFVLMPFSEEFDDIYKLGIRPACENAGAYAERVDEQIFIGSITQRVYNQISKADVIVAEMTGRNPNVFYEVGYAHALGKAVVLLAQDAKDIPFDLKDYPHIIYAGRIAGLVPEVEKRVRWCLEHVGGSIPLTLPHMLVVFNGTPIVDNPVITYRKDHELTNGFGVTFDVNNSVERVLKKETFQFSVVTPSCFTRVSGGKNTYGGHPDAEMDYPRGEGSSMNVITLTDGRFLHVLDKPIELYPGAWASLRLFFSVSTSITEDTVAQLALVINTAEASREYPFRLQVLLNQKEKGLDISQGTAQQGDAPESAPRRR